MLVFKLLMGCLKYLLHETTEVSVGSSLFLVLVVIFYYCGEMLDGIFMSLLFLFGPSRDYRKLVFVVEHVVEAYIVVLKSLAG